LLPERKAYGAFKYALSASPIIILIFLNDQKSTMKLVARTDEL
jgi:hypothetical protein